MGRIGARAVAHRRRDSEQRIAALEAENKALRERQDAVDDKLGLKTVETGGPSAAGGARNLAELNAQFQRREISFDEFSERSKELKKESF